MGRNTHTRSHRYISSGRRAPKRSFNWNGIKVYSDKINNHLDPEKAVVILQGALIIMPWSILFAFGALA